jgi:hypothetical protein
MSEALKENRIIDVMVNMANPKTEVVSHEQFLTVAKQNGL